MAATFLFATQQFLLTSLVFLLLLTPAMQATRETLLLFQEDVTWSVTGVYPGVFAVDALVGSANGKQTFRLGLDSSQSTTTIADLRCVSSGGCNFAATDGLDPENVVSCHSDDCAGVYTRTRSEIAEEGQPVSLPTICTVKDTRGEDMCPRGDAEGLGSCVDPLHNNIGDEFRNAHITVCGDSLSLDGLCTTPEECCTLALSSYYADYFPGGCDASMVPFGVGGTLRAYCPHTCGDCVKDDGAIRYCADDLQWTDINGNTCDAYRSAPLHSQCFASSAFLACPEACGACGDCCASREACWFYSDSGTDATFSGGKASVQLTLGRAESLVQADAFVVGVFDHIRGQPEPFVSSALDGMMGLGLEDRNCYPSCQDGFLASLSHDVGNLYALCGNNEFGYMSVDFGQIHPEHIQDTNGDGKRDEYDILWLKVVDQDTGASYPEWLTNAPISLRLGPYDIFKEAAKRGFDAGNLANSKMQFDLASPGIFLPLNLFQAFVFVLQYTFDYTSVRTFGPKQIPMAFLLNTSHSCGGPVPADYNPSADFPAFSIGMAGSVGHEYFATLDGADYVYKTDGAPGMPSALPGEVYICLAIRLHDQDVVNLGIPFYKSFYTVFDKQNMRIGISRATNCAADSGETSLGYADGADCRPHCPSSENGACASSPCQYGGSCEELDLLAIDRTVLSDTWFCHCVNGYRGSTCQENIDNCASNPCGANGQCIDALNSFSCNCEPGFLGELCDRGAAAAACNPNPCAHGASCQDWTRFSGMGAPPFSCHCAAGSTGTGPDLSVVGMNIGKGDCDVDINECDSQPCLNGGLCIESSAQSKIKLGAFECQCLWPFAGNHCEEVLDASGSAPGLCSEWLLGGSFPEDLTTKCCGADSCMQGYPSGCPKECADLWLPFWRECQVYVEGVLGSGVRSFGEECESHSYSSEHSCSNTFWSAGLAAVQRTCGFSGKDFPKDCSDECRPTYEWFYDACHASFVAHHFDHRFARAFLATCEGLGAFGLPNGH
jgi:hypothetical protein